MVPKCDNSVFHFVKNKAVHFILQNVKKMLSFGFAETKAFCFFCFLQSEKQRVKNRKNITFCQYSLLSPSFAYIFLLYIFSILHKLWYCFFYKVKKQYLQLPCQNAFWHRYRYFLFYYIKHSDTVKMRNLFVVFIFKK